MEADLIIGRGLNVNISFHTLKSNPALNVPFIANPQLPDYGSRRNMTQTHAAANGETFSGCQGGVWKETISGERDEDEQS